MDWSAHIHNHHIKVRARPGADETKVLGCDEARHAVKISVAAPAQDNKANILLLKFLKKQLGKQVRLVSGATSRDKVVEIVE
ncbi:YggU family protein [Candidatus Woesearchaeota archaeon]|nr:YggU family protein [Candidatus Woesearchaeota archaeon]